MENPQNSGKAVGTCASSSEGVGEVITMHSTGYQRDRDKSEGAYI